MPAIRTPLGSIGSWKFEEDTVDEERCYVVRDAAGDYWTLSNGSVDVDPDDAEWGKTTYKERTKLTRSIAHAVVRLDGPRHYGAKVYRLIPRAKPKAPREVFVGVTSDGRHLEFCSSDRDSVARHISGQSRVVRYVLAEGE